MNITPEIFQVGGSGFTASEDAAVYLICFDEEAALVDAGCGGGLDRLLSNIDMCGVAAGQIRYLLLTHCHYDHTGGAAAIRNEIKCKIAAHELDAVFLENGDDRVTAADWYRASIDPFAVDIKLTGPRQEIQLGNRTIEAIHIPGHSPGSVAYLAESEGQRVLFGQDVHGPLAAPFKSNALDYRRSLEKLISLEADILCEGHYGVIKGKKQVEGFIKSFLK
jgi:glyoxylase-like metal-dependent hydrolase (beta-lactamase superfamily II)